MISPLTQIAVTQWKKYKSTISILQSIKHTISLKLQNTSQEGCGATSSKLY